VIFQNTRYAACPVERRIANLSKRWPIRQKQNRSRACLTIFICHLATPPAVPCRTPRPMTTRPWRASGSPPAPTCGIGDVTGSAASSASIIDRICATPDGNGSASLSGSQMARSPRGWPGVPTVTGCLSTISGCVPTCAAAASARNCWPGRGPCAGARLPLGLARHVFVPAPEFYPKFGYREFGRLDYPPDQQRIFFQKRLMPEG
jgi:hypothetical protein